LIKPHLKKSNTIKKGELIKRKRDVNSKRKKGFSSMEIIYISIEGREEEIQLFGMNFNRSKF